jgi:FecR-like protein
MSDGELSRLGRHVAEQEDMRLEAAEPSESARRFLAEYAARRSQEEDPGREQGEDRASTPQKERGPLRTWLRLSLAASLVLGVFALKEAVFWDPPLSFTVGSETGVLRDWESAPDDAHLPIRFSDGTSVDLEPGARARVVAVGRAGAEIVIESGRAHIEVVPVRYRIPGESPWRVSLGPFAVEVKGTRFDVEWQPHGDDFALDLFEGSVSVSGCESGHSHTLVAGQGVRASCSKKQWSLVTLDEAARAEAVEAEVVAAAPVAVADVTPPGANANDGGADLQPPAPARKAGPARARDAMTARSWRSLALGGHYAAAYEAALGVGFEAESERIGAEDLTLLGDTARLNGDSRRAEAAYRAARQRFAGSAAAARAAFALGRLAVKSDPQAAIRWFESYAREQPGGPLIGAADDWLFELVGESGTPARRREIARAYLERHPEGPHAGDARRILDADER